MDITLRHGDEDNMDYNIGARVLDGWEIVSLIGERSFGKVYEIQETNYRNIVLVERQEQETIQGVQLPCKT